MSDHTHRDGERPEEKARRLAHRGPHSIAEALLAQLGRDNYQQERERIIREKREAEEREAQHAADLAEATKQQDEAIAATQARPAGIALQPSPPTHYQCPVTGEMVPFASSTEPLSRGMQPPR